MSLSRNFLFNPPGPPDIKRGDIRIDHNLSGKNHLFGHYSHSNELVGSSPDAPAPAWGNTSNAPPFTCFGQSGMVCTTGSTAIPENWIFGGSVNPSMRHDATTRPLTA